MPLRLQHGTLPVPTHGLSSPTTSFFLACVSRPKVKRYGELLFFLLSTQTPVAFPGRQPVYFYNAQNLPRKYSYVGKYLLDPQYPGAFPLRCLLLLVTLVERRRALVITSKVVRLLDLVDPNDPVLARERLFNRAELRSLSRESRSTDTVGCLSGREERVVVVVGHLVPGELSVDIWETIEFISYIKLFFIVGVASSSTRYSPRGVKKLRSLTSSGQIPSAMRTIQRNLLISSPEYPRRPPKTTKT